MVRVPLKSMKACLFDAITSLGPLVRDMAGEFGFKGGPELVLPPMKLATIAATLRNEGWVPSIIDPYPLGLDREGCLRRLQDEKADVYIGEVTLASIEEDISFLKDLSGRVPAPVIPMTGLRYEPLLKKILIETGAPHCLCGEVELLAGRILSGGTREGTARLNQGKIVATFPRIEDLDRIPIPARDLLPNNRYRYHDWVPITTMKTSRGCPFPCGDYCPYPLTEGRSWRALSPERLIAELEDIARFRIPFVYFRDTNFTYDKRRLITICRQMQEKKLSVQWICETRANCLDREMLAAMRDAGCVCINIGIETGDAALMEQSAKRGVSARHVIRLKRWADRLGIRQQYLFMVGLPGETRSSLYHTLRYMLRIEPVHIGINLLNPYPGTALYERALKKGWIEVREWNRYDGGDSPIMRTDELSLEEIVQARRLLFEAFRLSKSAHFCDRLRLWRLKRKFRRWAWEA